MSMRMSLYVNRKYWLLRTANPLSKPSFLHPQITQSLHLSIVSPLGAVIKCFPEKRLIFIGLACDIGSNSTNGNELFMSKNAKHFSIIGILIVIVTVITYYTLSAFFFELPEAASAQAEIIDALFDGHFILIAFLFAIVVVPMVYSIVVFRQQEGDETDAPHIHENTTLEIAWTVLPMIFVIFFGVWGLRSYNQVIASSSNEVEIWTQAQKWDWNFVYPDHDYVNSTSLVLQEGVPIVLKMQSRDIIHAFWVPKFRVKQDVFPFDVNNPKLDFTNSADYSPEEFHFEPQEIRFTPVKQGVYRVRCAEICGTSHYAMLANVFVLNPTNYQAWLDGEYLLPPDPAVGNTQAGDFEYYLDELSNFTIENGYTPPPDEFAAPAVEEEG
ncbi:MAG: cytochrome c oxidase subunit 2 [Cellvibrionaceae bacterium]|jgi:cytochrome c oxidase subunit 2